MKKGVKNYTTKQKQVKTKGKNLAALTTGLTKGTKEDKSIKHGITNLPPELLGRIGSFLSGKEGDLKEQRIQLRNNISLRNNKKPVGGAGAPSGGRRHRYTRRRK